MRDTDVNGGSRKSLEFQFWKKKLFSKHFPLHLMTSASPIQTPFLDPQKAKGLNEMKCWLKNQN